jgi:hypothetical protein
MMDELANRFRRSAHVAPADIEAFLAKHAHPASAFVPAEGEPDGHSFKRLEQTSTYRSPDEDDSQPTGESDHNEREEKSRKEYFIGCGTTNGGDRSQEKVIKTVDMTGKDTDNEEGGIDKAQYQIDVLLDPICKLS